MTELFKITQLALNDKPITFKLEDEKSIFIALKENGLFGLVGPYLDKKYCSDKLSRITKNILYEYIKRDIKQQALIQSVTTLLSQNKIKHIFLKGSRLKPLYKETYMRGMGDIDILVESNQLETIKHLFEQASYTLESRTPAHDFYRIDEDLIIEVHPRLYNDFNPKYKPLFEHVWTHASNITDYRYELEFTFEILYLMTHLAKHLESSGIGLRSILDIGIY
jgi:predicted nucleotidyltransferase